jgi:NhaP-type Na+/H+ or K+/H+ antiporter
VDRRLDVDRPVNGAAVALGLVLVYAVVAGRLDRWSITAPMVLVTVGAVLGDSCLGILHITAGAESVKVVAELTLALLLFADASTIRLRAAEEDVTLPARLLGIGLPLTIALGAVVAHLVFAVSWAQAALVGSLLAPTDAALGLAVVTNPAVPARIRRALTIESGLNDGIATPFVVFFLAVAAAEADHQRWVATSLKELGLAVVFGAGLGWLVGAVGARARRAGWSTPLSDALVVLVTALLAYQGAVAIGANGFVAAFVAGSVFGTAGRQELAPATELTEDLGLFASFAVWVVFGAVFVGPTLAVGFQAGPVLYAVLSLTVVRMVPVALGLIGTGLRRDTVAFVGWFGPRGLASVVFTLLVYEGLHASPDATALGRVATWTILLSVVAHGLSSGPLAGVYARRLARAPSGLPELADAPEHRTRRRALHDRSARPAAGADGGADGR